MIRSKTWPLDFDKYFGKNSIRQWKSHENEVNYNLFKKIKLGRYPKSLKISFLSNFDFTKSWIKIYYSLNTYNK